MKADERALLIALATANPKVFPRDAIAALGLVLKRCWRILEKWARRGWYEYGVSIDLGWLTDNGLMEAWVQMDHVVVKEDEDTSAPSPLPPR